MCFVFQARAYLLSAGFSLAFGSMFTKTYRVHRIFTRSRSGVVKNKVSESLVFMCTPTSLLFSSIRTNFKKSAAFHARKGTKTQRMNGDLIASKSRERVQKRSDLGLNYSKRNTVDRFKWTGAK
jgi:hypothetical protein